MDKPFDALLIYNFFSEVELTDIWAEITQLLADGFFQSDSKSHKPATEVSENELAVKKGFFPSSYFPVTNLKTHKACCKIFESATRDFSKISFACRSVLNTNRHDLLFSVYKNGGKYKPHVDRAITTVLFWLCKEPRKFSGGDLILHDIDKTIEFTHNRVVMVPGWCTHEVTPVVMDDDEDDINGRFCLSMFMACLDD